MAQPDLITENVGRERGGGSETETERNNVVSTLSRASDRSNKSKHLNSITNVNNMALVQASLHVLGIN